MYFIEEPVFGHGPDRLDVSLSEQGVHVAVPHLDNSTKDVEQAQADLLQRLLAAENVLDYVLWFYTPMALPITRTLKPLAVVYDCMDQLSAFRGAPPDLIEREGELFDQAQLVFTGGQALYEAKQHRHANVHAFPSSVDIPHFAQARAPQPDPEDQARIMHPRLGFFGVVDERMDLGLLAGVAAARPDWQLVIIGPVVKVDEADLPRAHNIHYLGAKTYLQLPAYISGWDVALLPFARNESTEFISPTKTPEYLAAGTPVVSTSIRDVIRPYGDLDLVRIADSVDEFVTACESALSEPCGGRIAAADAFLADLSWDKTWSGMAALLDEAVQRRTEASSKRELQTGARLETISETPTSGGASCSTISS